MRLEASWTVVISGSAEGLDGLRHVVEAIQLGLAGRKGPITIVAIHMSQTDRGLLKKLVGGESTAQVVEIEDGMAPQAGIAYLVPGGRQLKVLAGTFRLEKIAGADSKRSVIDEMLESVAVEFGERTIAVLLSGTGRDAIRGVEAVRAAGGVVILEGAATARSGSMNEPSFDSEEAIQLVWAQDVAESILDVVKETPPIEQASHCKQLDERRLGKGVVSIAGVEKKGTPAKRELVAAVQRQRAEMLLQARALDATVHGVVISDTSKPHLPIIYVNKAFEQLTGFSRAEVMGRSCAILQGDDRHQPGVEALRAALDRRESVRVRIRNYRKNGEMFWNELSISMVKGHRGEVTHMVGVQRDVTELIESEEALMNARRREAEALAFAGVGTMEWRLRDGLVVVSEQQSRLLGMAGNKGSIRWRELQARVHPEDLKALSDAVSLCVNDQKKIDVEWRVDDGDGGWRWLQMRGDVERDSESNPTQIMAICQDVTTRRAAEERAAFISQHDFLTGLPNKTLLRDRLKMALRSAERTRTRVALMFIDLDRFKEVNDSLGHEVGDELLRSVADRLKQSVRGSDTVSRLGGDEYVLLITDIKELDEAGSVATKALAEIKKPMRVKGKELHVSGSIGVCVYPDDGSDAETLMRHADAAMYRAKGGGRNVVCFYSQDADDQQQRNFTLREEMREALKSDQLRLHVQPQLSLADGRLVGHEALLRWEHPTRGFIGPDQFYSILEDSEFVEEIGRWVLTQACKLAVDWRGTAAGGAPIAVNVSALQLRDSAFANVVQEVLAETGARPEEIEIEVTERAMLSHGSSAATTLGDLRRLGIGIALDDFGTGYSSLSQLHQQPISKLKIDRSFCSTLPGDRSAAAIVTAIIQMASTLGMSVVAEGVELEDQAEFLRAAGCESVQGFLHTPALDPQDALLWIEETRSVR